MIDRIAAIALNTYREAIRDRILVMFVVFAVLLMASSTVLSWLTVGSELRIVTDLGLAAFAVFGTLMAIFIGITLVHKEIEKRTIYAVLAKPVPRWQFLVGKYCGLMLALAVVSAAMAVFYLGLVWVKAGAFPAYLLPALLLAYAELSIITAAAIVFSSFTTPMLAAIFTVAVYVVGHLSWGFGAFVEFIPTPATRVLVGALYYALPDLETFNVRSLAAHELSVSPGYVLDAIGYGIAYTAGMLVLAVLLFRNRDLT